MPSVSKPQATLMAMAAHNPAFAKHRGIPVGVARDFNRADQGTGILKRGAGGATPAEAGMDAKMNFGMGHGNNMFSTMPLLGHALSGTQLGDADTAIRNAGTKLARFSEGGEVKKPSGPSAKERKEIRAMIERGKNDAITALRETREALMAAAPANDEDFGAALGRIRQRLADGGEVNEESPQAMYQEYRDLMAQLEENQESAPPDLQMQLVERLAELAQRLQAVGVQISTAA